MHQLFSKYVHTLVVDWIVYQKNVRKLDQVKVTKLKSANISKLVNIVLILYLPKLKLYENILKILILRKFKSPQYVYLTLMAHSLTNGVCIHRFVWRKGNEQDIVGNF